MVIHPPLSADNTNLWTCSRPPNFIHNQLWTSPDLCTTNYNTPSKPHPLILLGNTLAFYHNQHRRPQRTHSIPLHSVPLRTRETSSPRGHPHALQPLDWNHNIYAAMWPPAAFTGLLTHSNGYFGSMLNVNHCCNNIFNSEKLRTVPCMLVKLPMKEAERWLP